MKLLIDITLGNEAMQTLADANAAIGAAFTNPLVSNEPLFQPVRDGAGGLIRDVNGNTVGRWRVLEEEKLASEIAEAGLGPARAAMRNAIGAKDQSAWDQADRIATAFHAGITGWVEGDST